MYTSCSDERPNSSCQSPRVKVFQTNSLSMYIINGTEFCTDTSLAVAPYKLHAGSVNPTLAPELALASYELHAESLTMPRLSRPQQRLINLWQSRGTAPRPQRSDRSHLNHLLVECHGCQQGCSLGVNSFHNSFQLCRRRS
jgi:hypothetical protein